MARTSLRVPHRVPDRGPDPVLDRIVVALFAAIAFAGIAATAHASELRIELRPAAAGGPRDEVELVVAWKNGWRDERSHDAAWVVVRDRARPCAPIVPLSASGARSLEGGTHPALVEIARDGIGAFVRPAPTPAPAERFGSVELRVAFKLAALSAEATALGATALEMVFIPAGSFELGDPNARARPYGAFFRHTEDGKPDYFEVLDETEIGVGRSPGELWYDAGKTPEYCGDQRGPIPEPFPKGTRAFWIMKLEFHQRDYADFLQSLPPELRARRRAKPPPDTKNDGSSSLVERDGSIVADAPMRPLNFVTWDDSCALLDWHGLRPMTEFEFEKAARGPKAPVELDFPWGTADSSNVLRRVEKTRDLRHATVEAEGASDPASRIAVGASYYGVLDLSGSIWERVVSAGHPVGRAFRGSLGDGGLDPKTAAATNPDWPRGTDDGSAAAGIGYRGGAEYFAPKQDLTNPFSIVGGRTYASWNGAFASPTYGARGVRDAD